MNPLPLFSPNRTDNQEITNKLPLYLLMDISQRTCRSRSDGQVSLSHLRLRWPSVGSRAFVYDHTWGHCVSLRVSSDSALGLSGIFDSLAWKFLYVILWASDLVCGWSWFSILRGFDRFKRYIYGYVSVWMYSCAVMPPKRMNYGTEIEVSVKIKR